MRKTEKQLDKTITNQEGIRELSQRVQGNWGQFSEEVIFRLRPKE